MEIIDILTLTQSDSPKFTVDLTPGTNKVALSTAGGPNIYKVFQNASAKKTFLNGDSFSILSAGLIIPEGFKVYRDPLEIYGPLLLMAIKLVGQITGNTYFPDVLSQAGHIAIPMDCFELNLDVFVDVPKQSKYLFPTVFLNENFQINTFAMQAFISMLSVPTIYNGKSFYCSPFIKVLHNFQMI